MFRPNFSLVLERTFKPLAFAFSCNFKISQMWPLMTPVWPNKIYQHPSHGLLNLVVYWFFYFYSLFSVLWPPPSSQNDLKISIRSSYFSTQTIQVFPITFTVKCKYLTVTANLTLPSTTLPKPTVVFGMLLSMYIPSSCVFHSFWLAIAFIKNILS